MPNQPSASDLDRIVAVTHPDPHTVLGPHREGSGVVIRAFRPDADKLSVRLPDASSQPMVRAHSAGLFELHLASGETDSAEPEKAPLPAPASYRIEIQRDGLELGTIVDPYAFWPTVGELDLHLASEGRHWQLYSRLGARVIEHQGICGTAFAVCAPSARRVSVVGDFNSWDGRLHAMRRLGPGIWELFIPGLDEGALYKFELLGAGGELIIKADPFGRSMELRPNTASRVTVTQHRFADEEWMQKRRRTEPSQTPMAIYEAHLGSWRHRGDRPAPSGTDSTGSWLSYRELAAELPGYVSDLGFTHIELMPVMEHPFDASWGYQVGCYFSPTSRYGSADDFRHFVDSCHQRGLGVILDWVPAHFPRDAFGLGRFDGTALYEHLDPRQGEHREWGTYVFNYGRPEVKNFLLSNALYWLDEFHIDGLRADAVASMLYLDYAARGPGDWVPNRYGGHENIEAIELLRDLTDLVHERFPGAMVIAEESTAWPGVTHSTSRGGLGFDFKWNMGWMHDTLRFFSKDPIYRPYHHGNITFGLMYAFSERFVLPLSHDEVVHMKGSLLGKMSGDRWQQFANLRALFAHMWAHPGKKLLFMGSEFGQWSEWSETRELDWRLLADPQHAGLQQLIRDLNRFYRAQPALYQADHEPGGFRWIDANDVQQSVVSYLRLPATVGPSGAGAPHTSRSATEGSGEPRSELSVAPYVVCVGNFTPMPRYHYRVGVPRCCRHAEVLNTDATVYGGSGLGNLGGVDAHQVPVHGYDQSIELTLPPLGVLWLVPEG